MQDIYSKYRELSEELKQCKKDLESLHERLYEVESEKLSLQAKIKELAEYIRILEGASRTKDEIIKSILEELDTYRKLLIALVIFNLILIFIVIYLSLR